MGGTRVYTNKSIYFFNNVVIGIEFQSNSPEYYYTKIADLKIDMLSLASIKPPD